MATKPPKLLDHVRETLRMKHFAYRTEQGYIDWIRRSVFFHNIHHLKNMGADKMHAFLAYLETSIPLDLDLIRPQFTAL